MQLFNTLSRTLEEIEPINYPIVTVYTCGPTVYDHAHIGHWFNYVRMDLLIRALRCSGLRPQWVMNITDVGHLTSDADEGEDKLEKGARREGKTAWQIAEFYTDEFLSGMNMLNILTPDFIVKATDHIADQIKLIEKLVSKGYGYIIDDGVYYDTSKFENYRQFARLDLDEQQAMARVSSNPQKHNSSDFALWKFSPKDARRDMEWDSPWGKGFPGWHIECSAMSMKYLGETIDIHCGGIDHIPVHHTNEIAQSEAVTGKSFANYWMHSNHISINNEKISKSLGNGITLEDIKAKGYSPEVLRLHVLESHYQSQSKFSWLSLEAAAQRLIDLRAMSVLRYQAKDQLATKPSVDINAVVPQVVALLSDNLDTPKIMAYLSNVSALLQDSGIGKSDIEDFSNMLQGIDESLGLKLAATPDIDQQFRELIDLRQSQRLEEEWDSADKTRAQLTNQHITVLDGPSGPRWHWSTYD